MGRPRLGRCRDVDRACGRIRRVRCRALDIPAMSFSPLFAMVFSIPSPASPFIFRLGALQPRWYGFLLACGVLLGGWLTRREFRRRGVDPELVYPIGVWAVPFGLVGARLYHVITDWGAFWPNHLADTPKIWQGGLGIWGAVIGGMLGVWIGTRRTKLRFWMVADCIAPGLDPRPGPRPLGQLRQPRALRPPLEPPLGRPDLSRPPLRPLPGLHHVPADVPLRVHLGRRRMPHPHLVCPPLLARGPLEHRLCTLRDPLLRHPAAAWRR